MLHLSLAPHRGRAATAATRPRSRPRRPRRGFGRAAAVVTAALLTTGLPAAPAGADTPPPTPTSASPSGAPAGAPGTPSATIGPVDYAVAVDESGSLKPEDLERERAAAVRIALGEVHHASTVGIFGFASADQPGQHPVDEVCPPTALDAAGRDRIGVCVAGLHSRTPAEGQGTDFPSAVLQGISRLTSGTDPAVPRVLFVLTDGKLDVKDSPAYGDPGHRAAAGEEALTAALAAAKAAGIQVWPLGFGAEPDQAALDRMAAGGFQEGCVGLPGAKPRASVVKDSGQVGAALEAAFAAAHCLRSEGVQTGRPPADLPVRISPLATVGSIVVDKGDPAVTATYFDPSGRPITGAGSDPDSTFEFSGRDKAIESLRITDPMPGQWRVHLDAPEGHRSQLASVSVLWRGALNSSISLTPPSPRAGEKATVTVKLQTRKGLAITDQQDLKDLAVTSVLEGEGFPAVRVDLADDGAAPDAKAGDATFTGAVTVPAGATGRITASSTLTASGLAADQNRPFSSVVSPAVPLVTAAFSLDGDHRVHPGDTLKGTLNLRNDDTAPHILHPAVTDVAPGLLTLSPDSITLAPKESRSVGITLTAGDAKAFGRLLGHDGVTVGGKVSVVDTSDRDRVVADSPLSVTVTPPPSFLDEWWWALLLLGILVVVAVLALLVVLRARKTGTSPAGLELVLLDGRGRELGKLTADGGSGGWYGFEVSGVGGPHPRLVRRPGGTYRVQRSQDGGAVLEVRRRTRHRLGAGTPVELADGLSLTLGASRRPGPGTPPPASGSRPGRTERTTPLNDLL
ncbi:VWA domain-containing protein [Kitasatospora sp. NPDC059577]|uniref:VWA domain-containing protein n=1 Tax=Kitasatospora sp. NPDC059577 TaxID=3346873 RepID=UPI0036910AF6